MLSEMDLFMLRHGRYKLFSIIAGNAAHRELLRLRESLDAVDTRRIRGLELVRAIGEEMLLQTSGIEALSRRAWV